MILSHVSSIQNRYDLIAHDFPVQAPAYAPNAVPGLRLVFSEYLKPGGTFFHADNFLTGAAGTVCVYSSVASSIASLVVDTTVRARL